jgi:hypothetical protein
VFHSLQDLWYSSIHKPSHWTLPPSYQMSIKGIFQHYTRGQTEGSGNSPSCDGFKSAWSSNISYHARFYGVTLWICTTQYLWVSCFTRHLTTMLFNYFIPTVYDISYPIRINYFQLNLQLLLSLPFLYLMSISKSVLFILINWWSRRRCYLASTQVLDDQHRGISSTELPEYFTDI